MPAFITALVFAPLALATSIWHHYTPPTNNFGALTPFVSAQLAAGADNGECLTTNGTVNAWSSSCGGGSGVTGGTAGMLTSWTNSTTITSTSSPTAAYFYATSTRASVFPYASSTYTSTVTASSTTLFTGTLDGAGLTDCDTGASSKLLWDTTTKRFSCGTDQTGAGGGAAYPFDTLTNFSTTTAATTSSIWTQGVFFSSSTAAASRFPFASSTALTAGNLFATNLTLSMGSLSAVAIPTCNGATLPCSSIGPGADGSIIKSTGGGSTFAVGSLDLADTDAVGSSILPVANGGTNASSLGAQLPLVFDGTRIVSSSTIMLSRIIATSTLSNIFPYASTTALTVSGNSYLGTISSGIWNGTSIGTTYTDAKVTAVNGAGGTTCSGTAPATCTSFSYLFNTATNYATTTLATTTSFWSQGVFFSSSTKQASQFPYASSTSHSVSGVLSAGTLVLTNDLAVAQGGTGVSTFGCTLCVLYSTATDGLNSEAAFTYSAALNLLTAENASTTALSTSYASSTRLWSYFLGVSSTTGLNAVSIGATTSLASIAVLENVVATSTAITIDWTKGNQQTVQLGTSATAIGFDKASTTGQTLRLVVCNPGAAAGALSFATRGILWQGGTTPTQTTTANKCDVWSFILTQATSTFASPSTRIFGAQSANF